MNNKELALQLTMAAIAGGAVRFISSYGDTDEDNKTNAEKVVNFYNKMVNVVKDNVPSSED